MSDKSAKVVLVPGHILLDLLNQDLIQRVEERSAALTALVSAFIRMKRAKDDGRHALENWRSKEQVSPCLTELETRSDARSSTESDSRFTWHLPH